MKIGYLKHIGLPKQISENVLNMVALYYKGRYPISIVLGLMIFMFFLFCAFDTGFAQSLLVVFALLIILFFHGLVTLASKEFLAKVRFINQIDGQPISYLKDLIIHSEQQFDVDVLVLILAHYVFTSDALENIEGVVEHNGQAYGVSELKMKSEVLQLKSSEMIKLCESISMLVLAGNNYDDHVVDLRVGVLERM